MKLRLSAVLLVLCTAIPTFARVLSYAPYTSQVAMPGYHERTSRHFLLIEAPPRDGVFQQLRRELVLYDTQGGDPRVVLSSSASVRAAALYEPDSIPGAPPVLLAMVDADLGNTQAVMISSDGGTTWKEIAALRNKVGIENFLTDVGGPWVQGLNPSIRIGSNAWPFIVQGFHHGVFAVSAQGDVKQISSGMRTTVHGQDASGTKFLLAERAPNVESHVSLKIVDVERGVIAVIANDFLNFVHYAGWIASDNTVYLAVTRSQGRFLYQWRNGQLSVIAGPRNAVAPPHNSDGPHAPRNAMDFIAVPTHDFNGAWMVQRGTTQPTTLLRYTPATGLETLWTDISGPEVEALIAGSSGQSVLIQVHRDRSLVEEQVIFVDPALAVWKLGEAMPREYDELYLNEEANKGFIHVNPDRLRDGEKFVFNSGSFETGLDGPISPPIGGGGDVIQEWGVVQASLKQHLILPGVARLQGGFGSEWRTDVTMYNPLDDAQEIEIEYVPLYEAAASPRTITVTLKAHEIRFVPDALQSLFLLETGGGSLHFHPAIGMNVVGRTYSRSGNGTYGFGMTGIDAFNAAGPRFTMTFAGAFPGEHFRTNILLTDTSGAGASATLSAFGVSGSIGSTGSIVTAPAGGTFQANGVHSSLNLFQRDAGGLVIQPTHGTAIATVIAIDNRTNDATWFPPDLSAIQMRTIPVIGHLAGANGSQFRSDLYLFNPTAETRTVVLEAKKWDSPLVLTRQFTLLPREARVIVDALQTLWNEQGLARLRYWTNQDFGEGVRITSRTYTVDQSGATYGSLIPPLNNFQIAPAGDALEIIGATAGPGFRTNIGLVEVSTANVPAAPTTVRIRIIDQDRRQLDTFTMSLPRASGVQLNDIFASRGITTPAAALIVVEVLDGGGLVGAYATLTDNVTNDTTYFGAQLAAQVN
ncbi:MAG TPA: hypothetical protein VE974_13235 [Thermoanaerobaculia bacterium]|nr:hypothetical protein [Thermoanaerobaculia bacterium]